MNGLRYKIPSTREIVGIVFSPDGEQLASSAKDGNIQLWNISTGRVLRTFKGDPFYPKAIAFSSDGRRLVSASKDQNVRLRDVTTGEILQLFKAMPWEYNYMNEGGCAVAISPDGKLLASACGNKSVQIWDTTTGKILESLETFGSHILTLHFSQDGPYL